MLGPSGSGKTTTLRMIAGFELPTEGEVLLNGVDVSRLPPYQRDVNTVFQDYALFPHMSVGDNVGYGLMVRRVGRSERKARVAEALELVRLPGFESRKPGQLSGGQRQRVALARALVNRPKLLLLDEPLGALDLKLREEMQIELKAIQKDVGITFVFVTHDQDEALTLSDRLAVFNGGRVEQVGSPAEVYENPQTAFVAGFVGTSNLLSGESAKAIAGAEGTFTVRPEKIHLADPGEQPTPAECSATGTVREVVYLGVNTRYIVALDGGRRAGRRPAEPGHVVDAGTRGARPAGASHLGPGAQPRRRGIRFDHRVGGDLGMRERPGWCLPPPRRPWPSPPVAAGAEATAAAVAEAA